MAEHKVRQHRASPRVAFPAGTHQLSRDPKATVAAADVALSATTTSPLFFARLGDQHGVLGGGRERSPEEEEEEEGRGTKKKGYTCSSVPLLGLCSAAEDWNRANSSSSRARGHRVVTRRSRVKGAS